MSVVERSKVSHLRSILLRKAKNAKCLETAVKKALKSGSLEEIQKVRSEDSSFSFAVFKYALGLTTLKTLEWLKKEGFSFSQRSFDLAARNGLLENMKWSGKRPTNRTLRNSVKGQNVEVIQWILEQGVTPNPKDIESGFGKSIDFLKFLISNGFTLSKDCYLKAKTEKEFAFLHENGVNLNMDYLLANKVDKSIEKLEWSVSLGKEFNTSITPFILTQTLENIKWMVENGAFFDDDTLFTSVIKEKMDVCEWLVEQKCPCGKGLLLRLVEEKKFSYIKYLRQNEYLWEGGELDIAVKIFDFDQVKWMIEDGAPFSHESDFVFARYLTVENLEWIVDDTYLLTQDSLKAAVRYRDLEVVKFLIEKGCKVTKDVIKYAAEGSPNSILRWLVQEYITVVVNASIVIPFPIIIPADVPIPPNNVLLEEVLKPYVEVIFFLVKTKDWDFTKNKVVYLRKEEGKMKCILDNGMPIIEDY